jgi:hypothetical protein
VDVRLLGPGLRPLGINAVGSSFHAVHHGLRGVASLFGIHAAPTRLRRRRLKSAARDAADPPVLVGNGRAVSDAARGVPPPGR